MPFPLVIEQKATIELAVDQQCMTEWDVTYRSGGMFDPPEWDVSREACPEPAAYIVRTETATNGGRGYRTTRYYCEKHVPRRFRRKLAKMVWDERMME